MSVIMSYFMCVFIDVIMKVWGKRNIVIDVIDFVVFVCIMILWILY